MQTRIYPNISNRTAWNEKYHKVRHQSEALCKALKTEDYVPQAAEFVSPPKWNLAHTSWFFETFILSPYVSGYQVFHPDFSYLFNSYYHHVGQRWIRKSRGLLSRPGIDKIMAYRSYVDKHMQKWIKNVSNTEWEKRISLLILGLNHEQQHQELMLTDLKYTFALNPLNPVYQDISWEKAGKLPSDYKTYTKVKKGNYSIGYQGDSFCFDNEKPVHQVYLNSFEIRNGLITNGEYLEFIESGAYHKFDLWLADAWTWIEEHEITAPLYWKKINNKWYEFTLHGLIPIRHDAPLSHISFYEADAFATWAGARLPTEFEWEVFANLHTDTAQQNHLLNREIYQPVQADETMKAPYQLLGTVWEWTYSAYHPYPGYRQAEGAIGEYNGKFMINQMVLRGGSCVSPPGHIRNTYRNFFYPADRWQFTGIRLAR